MSVPVVDLSGLGGGGVPADDVGAAIDDACRSVGFFSVTGHGVDHEVIEQRTPSCPGLLRSPGGGSPRGCEAVTDCSVRLRPLLRRGTQPLDRWCRAARSQGDLQRRARRCAAATVVGDDRPRRARCVGSDGVAAGDARAAPGAGGLLHGHGRPGRDDHGWLRDCAAPRPGVVRPVHRRARLGAQACALSATRDPSGERASSAPGPTPTTGLSRSSDWTPSQVSRSGRPTGRGSMSRPRTERW